MTDDEDYSLFSKRSNVTSSRYLNKSRSKKHWNTIRNAIDEQRIRGVLLSLLEDVKHKKAVKEPELELISSVRNVQDEYTVVAYVNSGSGGGKGSVLCKEFMTILGKDNVFDLKHCSEDNMPEDHLFKFALDPMVRVLVCGGDGTIGWIETAIDKVWEKLLGPGVSVRNSSYADHLPVAVIPLGTGNDLSRTFGWGGAYKKAMGQPSYITNVVSALPSQLDRWRCVIIPESTLDEETRAWVPRMLQEQQKDAQEKDLLTDLFQTKRDILIDKDKENNDDDDDDDDDDDEGALSQAFDGIFCNYFSIGFDAKIAFAFHKEREKHPERFTSPAKNKLKYVQKSMVKSRRLRKRVKLLVAGADDQLQNIAIPSNCRAIVLMNIQSYGGGNKLVSKGSYDDGLIEVFFLSSLARMAAAAVTPFKCKVVARAKRVVLKTEKLVHCQVDGEPWQQTKAFFQISHHSINSFLKKAPKPSKFHCTKNDVVVKEEVVVKEDVAEKESVVVKDDEEIEVIN